MLSMLRNLLVVSALAFAPPAAAQSRKTYAITDVTVVPMDRERLIPNQTVIVRDGRIASIRPAKGASVPAGAVRISGKGRYLMPGLAEMHAHVPPSPNERQFRDDVLLLYVANGITFARSMLGAPHHLELRAQAERGEIVSPRLYLSGPSLNGNSVASPEAARKMVTEQKAAGYETMKIHPGLDRPRYDAIAETARSVGITFGGHVPEAVGLARALEVRQATIDHFDGYMELLRRDVSTPAPASFFGFDLIDQVDESKIPALVRRTREAGVWMVPTESLMHHVLLAEPGAEALKRRPEMRYVSPAMLAQWEKARAELQAQPGWTADRARRFVAVRAKLIKAMHDGGAGMLLGSDAPQWFNVPGFSLHRELQYLVAAGLTPYQALATGTRNVARFVGQEKEFGTVETGRRADLLLVDANPLADVANVQRRAGVFLGGRWIPASQLDAGLAAIAARHKK